MNLKLTMACTLTDRVRAVLERQVDTPGVEILAHVGEPEDIFKLAMREARFDITEMSMSSHILTTARGDSNYVGVPVFPSRSFRHSSIFVNSDSGISRPEQLIGKRIGLPEYQQTAAMWARGILAEQHGVTPADVNWVMGGQESPGMSERTALQLPKHISLEQIGPEQTLNGMLVSGEIDALITPRAPSSFIANSPAVRRLFQDYRSAEVAYFQKNGFFPIMHCLAIRKSVSDAHPWLATTLFEAFCASKALAMANLRHTNFARTALPWLSAHYEETVRLMGQNIWSYGLDQNADELEAMTRYAYLDGQTTHKVEARSLFHPSTHSLADDPKNGIEQTAPGGVANLPYVIGLDVQ